MLRLNVCTYVYHKVGSCVRHILNYSLPGLPQSFPNHSPASALRAPPQGFLPPTTAKLPYVSRHPFMHPDTYLPPHPWARPHIIHPLVYLASYPLTHPCTNSSTYPLNHLPTHACIHPSTHPLQMQPCMHTCPPINHPPTHPTTQASSHVSLC